MKSDPEFQEPSIRSYGCRCLSSDGYLHEHHRHARFRKRLEFRLEIEIDLYIDSKSKSNIDSKSTRLEIVTYRLDSPDASTRISTRRLVPWRPDITSVRHFLGAARRHGPNTTCPGLQARRAQATIIFTPGRRPDRAARKAVATVFETATKALQAAHDLEPVFPGDP